MSKAFWVRMPQLPFLWILRSMAKRLYGKRAVIEILLEFLLYEGFNDLGEAVDEALQRGTGEVLLPRRWFSYTSQPTALFSTLPAKMAERTPKFAYKTQRT